MSAEAVARLREQVAEQTAELLASLERGDAFSLVSEVTVGPVDVPRAEVAEAPGKWCRDCESFHPRPSPRPRKPIGLQPAEYRAAMTKMRAEVAAELDAISARLEVEYKPRGATCGYAWVEQFEGHELPFYCTRSAAHPALKTHDARGPITDRRSTSYARCPIEDE